MPHDKERIEPPLPEVPEELEALEASEPRGKKPLPRKEFEDLLDQRDYLLWPDQEDK